MRIEEAFGTEGIRLDPSAVFVSCPACSMLQAFSDASQRDAEDGRTEYVCVRRGCGEVIAIVGPSSLVEGQYRAGDYAVWVACEDRRG